MLRLTQVYDPDEKVADCVEAQDDAVEEQKRHRPRRKNSRSQRNRGTLEKYVCPDRL